MPRVRASDSLSQAPGVGPGAVREAGPASIKKMSLVPSLLQAIVHVDGEALVLHAGDKPYVVAPTGQIELANRGLTLEAVNGIVAQLLPMEFQHALDEFGAAQYDLPRLAEFPGEQFTVVVARGGDDVWAEIRRRKVVDDDRIPEQMFGSRCDPSARAPHRGCRSNSWQRGVDAA